MKRATHTSFRKGQRIRIATVSGDVVITKFGERRSKFILTGSGKFYNADLSSVVIYKGGET